MENVNAKTGTSTPVLRIVLFVLALIFAGIVFALDSNVPLGIAIGSLYTIVVLFSWLLEGRYDTLIIAFISTILLIMGYVQSPLPDSDILAAQINRVISLVLIWICSMLVMLAKRGFDGVEKVLEILEEKVEARTKQLRDSQEELKESEQLYRYLYEHANEMYVSVDPVDASIIKCNETLSRKLGYSKDELIGEPIFKVYHPDCLDKVKNAFEKFQKTGVIEGEELLLKTKAGEKIDVILNVSAAKDDEGNILYSRSSWTDVTDYKNAQKKALEHETRMRHMVESVTDYAIIAIDSKGKVLNWNKGAERLKGYTAAEIIGKNFTLFYNQKDQKSNKPQELLKKAKKEGHAITEGVRVKNGGEEFWANVTITPIYDEQGKIEGFSKITRDLTERKKAEDAKEKYTKELELRNKELEQFVYIASHDLQEPLRTVTSFTELLNNEYAEDLDETGKKSMRFILEATDRMRKLILALLHYGQIGKDKVLETVDCEKVVENLKVDLGTIIEKHKAEITVGKLPKKVKGYPTEIGQLFQNLISNAVKFSPPDRSPKIHISSEQKNGHWHFAVKDNGIGISEEHQDRIFKIFQRLHKRKEFEGTGIGLAHCKKIVDLHQGDIWVDSTVGEGSTFYFTIPK